ncbi:hypothetical protein DSO57_1003891 [Entomophthora muscae]|uniref:Uncharacterized protein n=1 Tax=Entomophthora muscae TaxID=34485 RepID=A0ACC2RN97_9FUNG|nr:hypothetical protein DSO57_1003891 [Entomophthora muscae]
MIGFHVLLVIGGVVAHSWLDCIGLDKPYIGTSVTFSQGFYENNCVGFGRGYPGRENRRVNDIYTNLVELRGLPDPSSKRVCGATGQTPQYSETFPMTTAQAGTTLKLWYQLSGHRSSTPVRIYRFKAPEQEEATYADQMEATLMLSHPFNQNCLDFNHDNTWCWAVWILPDDLEAGVHSFMWSWAFDQNPPGEEYNTCFDIEIEAKESFNSTSQAGSIPSYSRGY